MKKRILLLLLSIVIGVSASATHIVGGEFELEYLTGSNYRLTLNLYYDEVNGNPAAIDRIIEVHIFDKGTNRLMATHTMAITGQSSVPYTNIDCTTGELRTRKVVYTQTIQLNSRYNNQEGYYIVYDRCCRNGTINNINAPGEAGQAFYMEFPPVWKNGSFVQNSSPKLFPPLSDYACVNELFYFDFSGTDPDGDSLVYEMVTPLNGFSNTFSPVAPVRSAPYPEISWLSGYNTNQQIQGSPPMSIDRTTGRLTVRPASKGLYVFGVRCMEYRNGEKIGEVRRDFQLLVKDCPTNRSPSIAVRSTGSKEYYNQGEVLRIAPSSDRCINLYFTDPDKDEPLFITARPLNFSKDQFSINGATSGIVNTGTVQDSLKATICFEECLSSEGTVYLLDLIVRDDGCSLPRQDTLRLSFMIEPTTDQPPVVSLSTPTKVFDVQEGDLLRLDVTGFDPDEQDVTLSAKGIGFDLSSHNISFEHKSGLGPITSPFSWQIDCSALQQPAYQIEFTVTSTVCDKTVSRTELIEVRTSYTNALPTISTDQQTYTFDLVVGEPFEARIFGDDSDLHQLSLAAEGDGFSLQSLGMDFAATGGSGKAEGTFKWIPTCEAVRRGTSTVTFFLKENACVSSPDQTIAFQFRVTDTNTEPVISTDQIVRVYEMELGQPFEAKFFGNDLDLDQLTLVAEGTGFSLADMGMKFSSSNGKGNAEGLFTWVANCAAFEQGGVKVNFLLKEDACLASEDKIITLEFKVKVPQLENYEPANIFTPNGDGLNDYFEIPSLPAEFCTATFQNIRIYNRWGKEVFFSNETNFKWDGKGVNDGVYFYVIDLNTTRYKGSVTLVR